MKIIFQTLQGLSETSATNQELLGIILKMMETLIFKDIFTSLFITVLFTVFKTWKQAVCPLMNNWIRDSYTYVQWNTILPHK